MVEQGDIIKIEGINFDRTVVVSKDTYNKTGTVVVCPVVSKDPDCTLKVRISEDEYVICDNMKVTDLNARRFHSVGRVTYPELIRICDMIQSIFDYY
ncbi:MAG: type II toxin-antitoxin system PemK/MazF family toxin [Lachnospiraceae bacterium]|nr:type II toxin-antitoxin system PemK/MazF family toxin [Lachnospiraceae bacterium]